MTPTVGNANLINTGNKGPDKSIVAFFSLIDIGLDWIIRCEQSSLFPCWISWSFIFENFGFFI